MKKSVVSIKGMHCRSCEILIEDKIKQIPEIKNVQINYKKNQALIYSHHPIDMRKVREAIADAGYEIGVPDSKYWVSKNPEIYWDLLKFSAVILALYLIAKKFGLFSLNFGSLNNPSNLAVVLLVGLTAGISTCMALVGGLVLGISARHSEKHLEATPAQKFRPHLFFNLGRILSYTALGGGIGLLGKAFQLSGTALGILTIGVGIVMFVLGAQLTELFPQLNSGGFTLPSGISKILGIKNREQKEYSHINSMLVGALTFFLPCGFTQAMQLYAVSTGNFWSGALIMGTFALGTAPGLLGVGGLTSILQGSFAKKFFRFTGIVVFALAIVNISNGLNLIGWKIAFSGNSTSNQVADDDPNVKTEGEVQVVRMDQLAGGYRPNNFTIKQGIPVKWVINSKADTCASSISLPKLGIKKQLQPGENIIEFTPKDAGELRFSCLMGMYSGKFIVEGK
jgi:sulfite exporter TauE/SafE/copper chaperone CopZ